ncbi:hypothetical protein ACIGFK_19645 [Streptomyces sp. NPDC085524]
MGRFQGMKKTTTAAALVLAGLALAAPAHADNCSDGNVIDHSK